MEGKMTNAAFLVDSLVSAAYNNNGKGFYLKINEHRDIWNKISKLEIKDSYEKEEVEKGNTKFTSGMRGHNFNADDIIHFIKLGMALKERGYDHIIAHITRTQDELE